MTSRYFKKLESMTESELKEFKNKKAARNKAYYKKRKPKITSENLEKKAAYNKTRAAKIKNWFKTPEYKALRSIADKKYYNKMTPEQKRAKSERDSKRRAVKRELMKKIAAGATMTENEISMVLSL